MPQTGSMPRWMANPVPIGGIAPARCQEMAASIDVHDVVEKDGVAFQVRPAWSYATGTRVQVGFDVALYGAHDGEHTTQGDETACPRCVKVWEDLRAIAASVVE